MGDLDARLKKLLKNLLFKRFFLVQLALLAWPKGLWEGFSLPTGRIFSSRKKEISKNPTEKKKSRKRVIVPIYIPILLLIKKSKQELEESG